MVSLFCRTLLFIYNFELFVFAVVLGVVFSSIVETLLFIYSYELFVFAVILGVVFSSIVVIIGKSEYV